MESRGDEVARLTRALLRYGAALASDVAHTTGAHDTDRRALQVLDELAADAATPPTPAVLAERLGLSRPATTALLDRLERTGLVERVRDLPDRRQVRLALSPRARAAGAQILGPVARRIDTAAAALSPRELTAVRSFLTAVLDDGADDRHDAHGPR